MRSRPQQAAGRCCLASRCVSCARLRDVRCRDALARVPCHGVPAGCRRSRMQQLPSARASSSWDGVAAGVRCWGQLCSSSRHLQGGKQAPAGQGPCSRGDCPALLAGCLQQAHVQATQQATQHGLSNRCRWHVHCRVTCSDEGGYAALPQELWRSPGAATQASSALMPAAGKATASRQQEERWHQATTSRRAWLLPTHTMQGAQQCEVSLGGPVVLGWSFALQLLGTLSGAVLPSSWAHYRGASNSRFQRRHLRAGHVLSGAYSSSRSGRRTADECRCPSPG